MPHPTGFWSHPAFILISAVLATWLISIRIYPVIIYIVQSKNLMDEPEERSSHGSKTPTLGGVGMFLSFSIVLMLFGLISDLSKPELVKIIAVVAATVILLFLGIKDDLIVLSPRKKFIGQILAAVIAIVATDVRIYGFGSLLGMGELPYLASLGFTLFVFLTVINAFNLIDGIDGLAGGVAGLASLYFGVYFLLNGQLMLSVMSLAVVGAAIGFLRYNLSEKNKLFMGDSGSLFLGYMLAYQGISFLMVNASASTTVSLPNATVVLLAILSFPLMDCLRVFTIRLLAGKSPFRADRNHIHHCYIRLGFTHKEATAAICAANLILIGLVLLMGSLELNVQLLIGFIACTVLYLYPFVILKKRERALSYEDSANAASPSDTANNLWIIPGIQQRRKRVLNEALGKTAVERNGEAPVSKPVREVSDSAKE